MGLIVYVRCQAKKLMAYDGIANLIDTLFKALLPSQRFEQKSDGTRL